MVKSSQIAVDQTLRIGIVTVSLNCNQRKKRREARWISGRRKPWKHLDRRMMRQIKESRPSLSLLLQIHEHHYNENSLRKQGNTKSE